MTNKSIWKKIMVLSSVYKNVLLIILNVGNILKTCRVYFKFNDNEDS